MESNRQKYVELSIAGRWKSLAREIISDNPGITRAKFIEMAAPLMPRHICRDVPGKKAGPVGLASDAICALLSQKAIYLLEGELFAYPKAATIGSSAKILEFASANKTIQKQDVPDIKNFSSLAIRLCKRGLLERVSKGVYKKVEATNDQN